jgi:hypothetical protein
LNRHRRYFPLKDMLAGQWLVPAEAPAVPPGSIAFNESFDAATNRRRVDFVVRGAFRLG